MSIASTTFGPTGQLTLAVDGTSAFNTSSLTLGSFILNATGAGALTVNGVNVGGGTPNFTALAYNNAGTLQAATGAQVAAGLTGRSDCTITGSSQSTFDFGTSGGKDGTVRMKYLRLGVNQDLIGPSADEGFMYVRSIGGFGIEDPNTNAIAFRVTNAGNVTAAGAFESTGLGAAGGFICKSPDGTRYRITVANGGGLLVNPA